MLAVPVFVILPEAKGVPAAGRTRTFCQVSVQGLPPELLLEMVMVRFEDVTVTVMVDPSAKPLMFLLALPPPFIRTVGAVPLVANTNPLGAFSIIVPVPTSPPFGDGS